MQGSDIIHFNVGLWDACNLFGEGSFSSEEEYVRDVLRVVDMMKRRYGATIVFATTTPALPTNKFYDAGIVDRFNSIIVPKLEEHGVLIDDIGSFVASDAPKYIRDDGVHLSAEGIEATARKIAEFIKNIASESRGQGKTDADGEVDTTGAPVLIK